MLKTYKGSCHCQAVQFKVDLDIAAGTGKCNCTICAKGRLWLANASFENFHLIAGGDDLVDYRGCNPVAHHLFCKRCGVRAFEWVDVPNMAGAKYYNINVACLDGVDVDELMAAPVTFYDGLNNAWEKTPAEVRHL